MQPRRRQAGFTLIELMVVVTIVALVMAAAGPAFSSAFADRRAVQACHDVLRIGRQAYWETISYRRAHLVHFTRMNGENSGRVELIRGDTNSCNQAWQTLRNIAACGDAHSRCIDWVDLSDGAYLASDRGPRLRLTGGADQLVLCYQPDGTVMHAPALGDAMSVTALNRVSADDATSLGGGYVFSVRSYDDGNAEGVTREILFPLGGVARRLQ